MSDDEQASMQTLRELVYIRYQQHDLHAWRARIPELTAALVAQGHFLPSWLYLGAPPSTTRQLLALFDQPQVVTLCNHLLQALSWIGDDLVREQFCAWREGPPPWQSHLFLASHEYAITAGWELTIEGGRRELYHQTCYELIPADEPELTPSRHAVAVSIPTDVSCGWCSRKLATLLDIDLHDPRCAFALEGEAASTTIGTRLRIAHCRWCSYYATLYTNVDLQGNVRWSATNEAMLSILEKVGLAQAINRYFHHCSLFLLGSALALEGISEPLKGKPRQHHQQQT